LSDVRETKAKKQVLGFSICFSMDARQRPYRALQKFNGSMRKNNNRLEILTFEKRRQKQVLGFLIYPFHGRAAARLYRAFQNFNEPLRKNNDRPEILTFEKRRQNRFLDF
jgi:hypothetical protein